MVIGDSGENFVLEDSKCSINICNKIKYLGVEINEDGNNDLEITKTTVRGRSAIAMLNGILWGKQIFKETKIHIYKSIVRSLIITYGAETWTINAKLNSKLQSTVSAQSPYTPILKN